MAWKMQKPTVLWFIQRGGQVIVTMLSDVEQLTIKPVITEIIMPGALW
jgi:hypothetical protein